MPNVDLTEMDLAVLECLYALAPKDEAPSQAAELLPRLQKRFPGYDEVAMREGESITRLRGRQLVGVDSQGRLRLTSLGTELAEGLRLKQDEDGTSARGS